MRAPLLSATSNLDRICTIKSLLLLDDFHQPPPFQLAERPGLHDANPVTSFCLVVFVMGVEFFHLFDDLAKLGMRHARDGAHHNCLIHAAGNHFTGARLTRAPSDRHRSRLQLMFVSHSYFASVCFSRCDSCVSILAMSRRSRRNRLGCSNWPLCCCKRR